MPDALLTALLQFFVINYQDFFQHFQAVPIIVVIIILVVGSATGLTS
jgi:predicted ABC-type exoprotein transport system permease subunit